MSPTERRVHARINRLTPGQLAYLAGVVDGDGSVQVRWYQTTAGGVYAPVVRIDNTSHELIEHVHAVVGLGSHFKGKPGNVRHKQGYGWSVSGFAAGVLLRRLLPFLRIKHAHAGLATALLEQCGPRDVRRVLSPEERSRGEQIFERVRELNASRRTKSRLEHVLLQPDLNSHGQRIQQARGAQLNPLDSVTVAYLAGMLDAEGRIGINTTTDRRYATSEPRHRVRLDIALTHLPALLWLHEQTGLGRVNIFTKGGNRRRPAWQWSLWTRQAEQLLSAVQPYLRVKKGQATLALELLEVQSAPVRKRGRWSATHARKQQRLVARIAELNRRGPA